VKIHVTTERYGSFESIEQPVNNLEIKQTRDWRSTQIFKGTLSLNTADGMVLLPVDILKTSVIRVTGLDDPKVTP
jgi:hypothetical protein